MSINDAELAELEAQAAAWAARLDANPDIYPPELHDWLEQDPQHGGALLRAQAILAMFTPSADAVHADTDTQRRWYLPFRRLAIMAGGAAALAASLALFMIMRLPNESYETQIGEVRSLALNDGSSVSIDAKSRIDLDFGQHGRDVHMRAGKVLFRATHDARRPFRVILDNIVITDIGTAFQVAKDDDGRFVDVLVTEGAVQVDGPSGRIHLIAGQRAHFSQIATSKLKPTPVEVAAADMDRLLAWKNGQLDLNGETLDSAVTEINRHSRVQIRVDSPRLGAESLYGSFRMDDPSGFARTVAAGLGAVTDAQGDTIVIKVEKNSR